MSWKKIAKASVKKQSSEPNTAIFDNNDVPAIVDAIRTPTMQTFTTFTAWLKKCNKDLKQEVLEQGALEVLLDALSVANATKLKFGDAILQLKVVQSIKSMLNCVIGMDYLIERNRNLLQDLMLSKSVVFHIFFFIQGSSVRGYLKVIDSLKTESFD